MLNTQELECKTVERGHLCRTGLITSSSQHLSLGLLSISLADVINGKLAERVNASIATHYLRSNTFTETSKLLSSAMIHPISVDSMHCRSGAGQTHGRRNNSPLDEHFASGSRLTSPDCCSMQSMPGHCPTSTFQAGAFSALDCFRPLLQGTSIHAWCATCLCSYEFVEREQSFPRTTCHSTRKTKTT